jgi:hypothetical protein
MIICAFICAESTNKRKNQVKKKPQTLQKQDLRLNPSFQRMEETIRAFNKIENYFIVGLVSVYIEKRVLYKIT